MRLTLCPLFSGSSGNCIYVACGGVRLLVDVGMAASRIEAELREIGVDIRDLDAVLITHEHVDHIRGIGVLCRKYGLPVYANEGTWNGIMAKDSRIPARCMRTFFTGEDFYIGDVNIHPFSIPHDALEPVGYAFSCKGLRCAVATDIGHIRADWMEAVAGSQAIVLEANHDIDMVHMGPYPQRLKQRILGRHGHLNNTDCAKALLELVKTGTQAVFLAHLSNDNNLPELAYNTVCEALKAAGYDADDEICVHVARRDRVSDLLILDTGDPA
ncbi:MAG: MBL fold metallo-hydrolase [Clostridia bacterium]|nr:MBL fold metallo-hydrolase [Clostridia bacterium]